MDSYYSQFEQSAAIAWAQAHLTAFLIAHPDATGAELEAEFLSALEGGLSIAIKSLRQK